MRRPKIYTALRTLLADKPAPPDTKETKAVAERPLEATRPKTVGQPNGPMVQGLGDAKPLPQTSPAQVNTGIKQTPTKPPDQPTKGMESLRARIQKFRDGDSPQSQQPSPDKGRDR